MFLLSSSTLLNKMLCMVHTLLYILKVNFGDYSIARQFHFFLKMQSIPLLGVHHCIHITPFVSQHGLWFLLRPIWDFPVTDSKFVTETGGPQKCMLSTCGFVLKTSENYLWWRMHPSQRISTSVMFIGETEKDLSIIAHYQYNNNNNKIVQEIP